MEKMIYRKNFAVEAKGKCFMAEIYVPKDCCSGGESLQMIAKEKLTKYLDEKKIFVRKIIPESGYTHTTQPNPEVDIVLRDPRDYEIFQYFQNEYADSTYAIPIEWTSRGITKVIAGSREEAEKKVQEGIDDGYCPIWEEHYAGRHDFRIAKSEQE